MDRTGATGVGLPIVGTPANNASLSVVGLTSGTTNYISGYPTAGSLLPDVLATPVSAYADQGTPIAAVTDTNAKTALTAINNSLLSQQAALTANGILIPSALQAQIAACATCGIFAFNPNALTQIPAPAVRSAISCLLAQRLRSAQPQRVQVLRTPIPVAEDGRITDGDGYIRDFAAVQD